MFPCPGPPLPVSQGCAVRRQIPSLPQGLDPSDHLLSYGRVRAMDLIGRFFSGNKFIHPDDNALAAVDLLLLRIGGTGHFKTHPA